MNDIIFIIPTIGRESLKESIQSLIELNDNYNWKAIVIFDGIKNNLIDKHENLIMLEVEKCGNIEKKNNGGLVRNKGIEYIINNNFESKFIGFLDDDDTIHPNYIKNLFLEKEIFDFDVIIFRMMYPNYKIVPHQLSNKIERCNIGISFALKYEIILKNYKFCNHPFEDYIFISILKKDKYKILISKYVNYFVRTSYNNCKDLIKNYPNILIG